MKVVIDRFEGIFAVVELDNKQFVNMPKQLIPAGADEGSVLSIEIDDEETKKRHKRVSGFMDKLWAD